MRPTVAEIDLRAIHTNLRNIRRTIGKQPLIMAVVKANAYGHGAVEVARSIIRNRTAQYFGVAIVEEGIELRAAKITGPIHVFTAPLKEQLQAYIDHDLEPTICDISIARRLNALAARSGKRVSVQIKVDTGMGRIGVAASDAVNFVQQLVRLKHLHLKGIWTHFATSDEHDLRYAHAQLQKFREVVTALELNGIHIPLVHSANSGAIMQMPESYFDMVRPGIMMYGYRPSLETRKSIVLRPAMSLKGKVGFVKQVEAGTSISYARRFVAKKKTTIASITVGYADGYFRTLTNKAFVLINGKRYPVAGTVCMDQIMVDVGNDSVKIGDEVVLMGSNGPRTIDAWQIASAAGTIPYEVTCAVSQRVPRRYRNGK